MKRHVYSAIFKHDKRAEKQDSYTCISRSKSVKPEARFSTGKKGKQDSTEDTNISRSLSMINALKSKTAIHVYVVVYFLSQVIFIFPLFLDMVIYVNDLKQRKNKNYLK